jgi:hypothetical protein
MKSSNWKFPIERKYSHHEVIATETFVFQIKMQSYGLSKENTYSSNLMHGFISLKI